MLDNAGQRQEAAVAKHRADVSKGESLRPPHPAVQKQTSAGGAQGVVDASQQAATHVPQLWPPKKRLRTKTSAPSASSQSNANSLQLCNPLMTSMRNRVAPTSSVGAGDEDDTLSAAGIGVAIGVGIAAVAMQLSTHSQEASQDPPLSPPCATPLQEEVVCRRVSSPAPIFCKRCSHVCTVNEEHGCSACGHTCHEDCGSDLCAVEPCAFCLSANILTPVASILCVTSQRRAGCHACNRLDCDASASGCHAKCTALNHVCGPSAPDGCDSCGRVCHRDNLDARCLFYARARHQLDWEANTEQLMDTQSGTGGALPHISQVAWHFLPQMAGAPRSVAVDGATYRVGVGDPGRATDGTCENNCLIDSLRQCLGLVADCKLVRRDLVTQYANASGRARVTTSSYLDVESHWQAILRSLFLHNTCGVPTTCNTDDYCVIALSAERVANGSVEGSRAASQKLVVMNYSDIHFDPCLPA